MKKWISEPRLRATLSFSVVLLVCAGCGDVGLEAPGVANESKPSTVEARADEIFLQLAGDATQREAVHYLEFRSANADFETCMSDGGFSVRAEFLPIWKGYEPNATSGSWMGELGRRPSVMALQNARSAHAEVSTIDPKSVESSEEYQRAVRRCRDDDLAVIDFNNKPGVPDGATDLVSEFKSVIFAIDEKLGPIQPYNECMLDAGFDLSAGPDGDGGWQGLYNYLVGTMPLPPMPGAEAAADEWQVYLELESKAIAADTQCRESKYREGLEMLEPLLDEFASQHAEDLDRFAVEWPKAVAEARDAGFEG